MKNLEREVHVHDAGHARYVAFRNRIGLQPVLEIFGPLLGGRGLIRDGDAFDDGPAGQHVEAGGVILKIGPSGAGGLPDAFEVGLAVGCARQSIHAGSSGEGSG